MKKPFESKPKGNDDVQAELETEFIASHTDLMEAVLSKIPVLRSFFDLKAEHLNYEPRVLYNNMALPTEMLDPKTNYPRARYATNKVRTTKYTPLNFVPKNILFQFKNIANIYFLLVAILSAFSIFGVRNAGLAAVPIIAIVAITAIRDAIEDWRRQVLDLELNNSLTWRLKHASNPNANSNNIGYWRRFKKRCSRFYRWVGNKLHIIKSEKIDFEESLTPAASRRDSMAVSLQTSRRQHFADPAFKKDYWKNVVVGDILKLRCDDAVPADVIVLSASGLDGSCFIETKSLDGETSLKPRKALESTNDLRTAREFAEAQFKIEVEGANSNLSSFGWSFQREGNSLESLSTLNFLPRGSNLKNTDWAVVYVVYTGAETKIELNAGETPTKRSRLTRDLNYYIYISFVFVIVLSFVGGVVEGVKFRGTDNSAYWFEFGLTASPLALNGFVNFWATLILLQNIIPISLYISIELVRTIQAFFIWSDVELYDEAQDYPCTPKSWSISDDLGQIEFVFSDKTGTLTRNSMVFRRCTVNGKLYGKDRMFLGEDVPEVSNMTPTVIAAQLADEEEAMVTAMRDYYENPFIAETDGVQLLSSEIYGDLSEIDMVAQNDLLHYFALSLAACNTVAVEHLNGELRFNSESPDEDSLVKCGRDLGYTLTAFDKELKVVDICGQKYKFKVILTLAFTSERRRMSVILQQENGTVLMLTKGADDVVSSRLSERCKESLLFKSTSEHLKGFAEDGLRTLIYAYKQVDPDLALKWKDLYKAAEASIDRDTEMARIAELIECDLELIGGSGIEDQLQDGVPETIQILREAGIKVWMLTGDKMETAVAIARNCNLLKPHVELFHATNSTELSECAHQLGIIGSDEEVKLATEDHTPASDDLALVVTGKLFTDVITDPHYARLLALIGKRCSSVVCCRVSPSQKAVVVALIKRAFDVTTLAIGDGANDVSMIQVADIGVGLVGVEGRQAAMSSDYAVGQFKFLQRLILVHGHWSYFRIAELAANLLYKNIVFTMVLFWYGVHNQFDNSYVFDYTYITLFNSVFTSLPVVFMGILDQDVPDKVMLHNPKLYTGGILRQAFTKRKFYIYVIDGLYQSAVCYFFSYSCFHSGNFVSQSGQPIDYRVAYGVFPATASVICCNFYVLINTWRWDWLQLLINFLSIMAVFFWTGIYTLFVASGDFYRAASRVYGAPSFWANLFLAVIVSMLPRFLYMASQKVFFPSPIDLAREDYFKSGTREEQPNEKEEISA